MEEYRDLSYYQRFHFENAMNVGFSSNYKTIADYELPKSFFEKLLKYYKYPVNMVRDISEQITIEGQQIDIGISEIRIISCDNVVFAAPDTIIDSIMNHGYYPPHEFIDAVIDGIDPDSDYFQEFLSRYDEEHLWGASDEYVKTVKTVDKLIDNNDLLELQKLITGDKCILSLVTENGSLLNYAIQNKKEEIADFLLDHGIQIDRFEGVELLTAVENGMFSIVRRLLDSSVPVKKDVPRNNPLFLAVASNQNEVAEYLYLNRRDLVMTYQTEYTRNCNILQWSKMFKNESFLSFLRNQL